MAKIMLVEDDNNLREIYEARLLAEGYEIVAAKDGEEALAMAVKEKPDLIIADVMMPKISGFDMLDILRGTPETKNVKVIVMTALSQAEDKARADKLGADRYLVKSQVTLEDVAAAAHEVLEGAVANASPVAPAAPAANPAAQPPSPAPTAVPALNQTPAPDSPPALNPPPVTPAINPATQTPVAAPATPAASPSSTPVQGAATTSQEEAVIKKQIDSFVASQPAPAPPPQLTPMPPPPVPPAPPKAGPSTTITTHDDVELPSAHKKVIEPINDLTAKPDLNELLAKEEAKEANQVAPVVPAVTAGADGAAPVSPVNHLSLSAATTEPDTAPHTPGQIIGPSQTPATDPSDPDSAAL